MGTGGKDGNYRPCKRIIRDGEQYSLGRILGIWALAAVPMGILSWIVFPVVSPDFNSDPLEFGVTRIVLLALGLVALRI